MKRDSARTISAEKRYKILAFELCLPMAKIGGLLQDLEAPGAYAAFRRLEKSLALTLSHALTKRIRDERGW
jgi:hypothetical protein